MQERVAIPKALTWLAGTEAGAGWLRRLPQLVSACSSRWDLELGFAYPDSFTSFVAPARSRRDGTETVLKIQYPDRESEHEAAALSAWGGDGAIHLLAHDPGARALLLERCTPGKPLTTAGPSRALEVLIGLLPRLWIPTNRRVRPLSDEAGDWIPQIERSWRSAGRPFARRLVDAAVEALEMLRLSQGQPVLVHQDLHPGNVLSAEREPWLVIDPKPLAGERAFGLAPIVRAPELGHRRAEVLHRLDRLSTELGVDRERTRLWALGQTVAWAFENHLAIGTHVEVATWLMDA